MDRRAFLSSSIAAGAAAFSRWPTFARAQAAAVDGVPRGLVSQTFQPLSGALLSPGTWKPYPKAGDPRWSTVPQQVRDALISRADAANSSPWPEMLATDELEFHRNGNRTRFEAISFGRRNRLADLVLAECIANRGKYLDQIANGVWLLCEESFWGVPAHIGGLADIANPEIELFGAETAATLGWVAYLLEQQLNDVSSRLVERIHLEAKHRILDPYFNRNDFGWMGLNGKPHHINNWNP